MANLNTIKNWFKTGLKPTQQQFWDTWDSYWHKDEPIPVAKIDGIDGLLNQKANKAVLDNHLADATAHAKEFGAKADKTYVDAELAKKADATAVAAVSSSLNNKLDKEASKSLVSNTEIARLATVTNYTHPDTHAAAMITQDANNRFVTDVDKEKLSCIFLGILNDKSLVFANDIAAIGYVHSNKHISTTGYVDANRLILRTDSALKPSTNTWTIGSDERLKENIQDYTKGLDAILATRPVTYDYNGKGGFSKIKGNVGVIAQEIKDVMPEGIAKFSAKLNKEDEVETELYNFNSHALTYVAINAIKELSAKITALEAEIQTLKSS